MEHVRQADISDLFSIKKLLDENFGVNFYTSDDLRQVLRSEDHYFYVYTDEDETIVALLYMFITTYGAARKILSIPERGPEELFHLKDDSIVGVYKSTCTDIRFRKHGILDTLMSVVEKVFRDRGIELILLDALVIPTGEIPAGKSLMKFGFRPLEEIPHPWSHIDSYCPYCKNRFCQCNAFLYIKELN